MRKISENINIIKNQIIDSAIKSGRNPSDIQLVAISKWKTADEIIEAYKAGQIIFGENYAQELQEKHNTIKSSNPSTGSGQSSEQAGNHIKWHFTGHLQKNKAKIIAPIIDCIETIDSIELAKAIEKRAPKTIDALIEVNIGDEESKSGVKPENLNTLVKEMNDLKKMKLKGLMIIPPYSDNKEESRPYFRKLKELLDELNSKKIYKTMLTELSMGMSHDFEVAIEEGATIIRVGTAIFGERRQY